MQFEWSYIIGILGILIPFLTHLADNRHNFKIKKLDYNKEINDTIHIHKRDILEKGLSSLGALASNPDFKEASKHSANILNVIPYVSEDYKVQVVDLVTEISNQKIPSFFETAGLASEIKRNIEECNKDIETILNKGGTISLFRKGQ